MNNAKYKTILLNKKAELNKLGSSYTEDDHYISKDNTSEISELSQVINTNNVLSLVDFKAKKELKLIEIALKKIEANEYGCCEECNESISEKRLLANPFALYCIDCQESMESKQKNKKVA